MGSFKVITDSSCDFTFEMYREKNVDFVPFYVTFDGETYEKELVDISVKDFYKRMLDKNARPKTSLPSVQDYMDCFEKYLKLGQDIICLCLTSKFSGSYQSAGNAANLIKEEYPERKIFVVDSMLVTGGQGILVETAVKMSDNNVPVEEAFRILEEVKKSHFIVFTVDSLDTLQRGGRIGKVSAFAGTLLNIKPIITHDDGELKPYSKIRGRKKAIAEIIKIIREKLNNNYDDYDFVLVNSQCEEEALEIKRMFEEVSGKKIAMPVFSIGVTIGAHIGSTAVGIGYIKKYELFL